MRNPPIGLLFRARSVFRFNGQHPTTQEQLIAFAAGVLAAIQTARFQPIQMGHYRILEVLGEGGMGMVYEAEQDQPRRIVALKVIKPEMAVLELLRHFEQEAQALGRLQHPGIA